MSLSIHDIYPLSADAFRYSKIYFDDDFEYRHVIVTHQFRRYVPKNVYLTEPDWRLIGIQMSPGWEHYLIYAPEPHIFLFRKPKIDFYDNFLKLFTDL